MFEVRMQIMPQTFVLIGCGGTGSRLLPLLAQFIKTCSWLVEPVIFLVDDDKVEEKNLLRQNFITPDIGKPKAEVLASRYSKAYNITIIPIVKKVLDRAIQGSESDVYSKIYSERAGGLIRGNTRSSVIISCVDNMEARRAILSSFVAVWLHHGIFLDGGNEDLFGQVMISNPNIIVMDTAKTLADVHSYLGLPKMMPVSAPAAAIPLDVKFYVNTVDQVSARSCADLDQTMAINCMVATTMFSLLQTIIYSRPINFNRLNISMAGTFPELLTLDNIARLAVLSTEYRTIDEKSTLRGITSNVYGLDMLTYSAQLVSTYRTMLRENEKAKMEEKGPLLVVPEEVPVVPPPLTITAVPRAVTRRIDRATIDAATL